MGETRGRRSGHNTGSGADHLLMDLEESEKRIAELERRLAQQQRIAELEHQLAEAKRPPARPGPRGRRRSFLPPGRLLTAGRSRQAEAGSPRSGAGGPGLTAPGP